MTPGEMERKSGWVKTHLDGSTEPAVLVRLRREGVRGSCRPGQEQRRPRESTPPARGAPRHGPIRRRACEVRCAAVEYADFPAVEWTVSLKNASRGYGLLEAIQGIDVTLTRGSEGEFVLHH